MRPVEPLAFHFGAHFDMLEQPSSLHAVLPHQQIQGYAYFSET